MEKSSISRDFPIAKAAYSFLQDKVSSFFSFPGWNKGRIICQRSQLKRILSGTESSSDGSRKDRIIDLSNSPFNLPGTRTPRSGVMNGHEKDAVSESRIMTRTEMIASTV
ncbi:pentatricopeptide repeat-containing protein [Quercus suber]|uniref:Pentatricopeptide repeat-containing protein n=1 Tax=Quercus suber TaxID=58331 RepID=A0AAW0M131_QUESU